MTATLDILDRLVAFDTVSRNSNLGIIAFIEDFLRTRGFAVHRIADDSGQKAGLFAALGPAGQGLMLSAHTDVVPVQGQSWSKPPFRLTREGDRLYGRGTTDMKGFLASALALADRAAGRALKEPLKLAISYDEEIGCLGIRRMIGHLAPTIGLPRGCIVGEPTGMRVATGHKGKAAFRALCHGESGHSALAPHFLNALHLAADFISALRGLQEELARAGARDEAYDIPYSTLHVGRLSGGTALNIVPDRAVLDFELRHLAGEPVDALLERIGKAAREAMERQAPQFPNARIELEQITAYPGLDTDPAAPIVTLSRSLAGTDRLTKVPFGTEAGFFSQLGIPTVVCGPGCMEGQGHKPDEYIALSQLAACDGFMDRLLDRLSG